MWDAIVIGSGFGGAVMSRRLTDAGLSVLVLERGDHHPTNMTGYLPVSPVIQIGPGIPTHRNAKGWIGFRQFENVSVVAGAGVGGGSLVYGNAFTVPPDSVWDKGWPADLNSRDLNDHYHRAGHATSSPTTMCSTFSSRPMPSDPTGWKRSGAVRCGREDCLSSIQCHWFLPTKRLHPQNSAVSTLTIGSWRSCADLRLNDSTFSISPSCPSGASWAVPNR